MPTGLHTHTHLDALFPQSTVELLRLFWVFESSFLELSSFAIHVRNLFEARVIVTAYNQHLRLLSPGLGWFAPSKSTRGVHVGRSRISRCWHLIGALWFCSWRVEPGQGH